MNKINTVSIAFENALNALNDLRDDLVTSIDQQKTQLLGLLDNIAVDTNDLSDLGKVCRTVGNALLALSDDFATITDNIHNTILVRDEIPVGSISTFRGYCADCGLELHIGDTFMDDGDGEIHCMACVEKFAAAEEVTANV
jgi:hypothetical protein